jgi:tetratricopeptide (TPR) repeat protein
MVASRAMHAVRVVATALLAWAVFLGGGSGNGSVATLGTAAVVAACGLVALSALGRLALPRPDRAGLVAAAAFGALVAWTGASVAWSIAGDLSWDALAKGLAYGGFAVVGLAVGGSGRRALRVLAVVLAAVLGAALVWSLAGVAIPALFPEGDRIARLRNPVGYWNALALLADAALALGLWVAASIPGRVGRSAGALLAYAAALALLLTQSRAGVVAAVAVVVLWLAAGRTGRLESALVGLLAVVPAALVAGWAFTRPALVEDGAARADRVSDGAVFAVLAVVGAVVVAALVLAVPIARLARERRRQVLRGLAIAGVVLVAVAAAGFVARVGDPVAWAGDQFSRGECVNDPSRLTELCANNRLAWWGEAVDVWRGHRLAGAGARTFELARLRFRENAGDVAEPHSLPLQLLSDTGLVGLALGLLAIGGAALGVVRAGGRLDGEERTAAVALAALPLAWTAHALVDYDLDFLAVTGPALLATAAMLGAGRPSGRIPGGWVTVAASGLTALAVAAVLVTPRLAARDVDRSYELSDEGQLEHAADAADRARDLDPLGIDPLLAAATVATQRGNIALATALYEKAVELQPENPRAWFELGLFRLLDRDDACAAYFAFNEAYTLDPMGRQWVPGGPLDVAREAVNNGACEP